MFRKKRRKDFGLGNQPVGPAHGRDIPDTIVDENMSTKRQRLDPKVVESSIHTLRKRKTELNKMALDAMNGLWDQLTLLCDEDPGRRWEVLFSLFKKRFDDCELKKRFFPSTSHHNEIEKREFLSNTEDISYKELASLHALSFIKIPHPKTIQLWRNLATEAMWLLTPTETESGVFIPAKDWCELIVKQRGLLNRTVTYLCWTIDYAKLPKMTLFGWQEVSPHLNQASSKNYHINGAFNGDENLFNIQKNCSHDITLLNGGPFSFSSLVCHPQVLVDFQCFTVLLQNSSLFCFLCDITSSKPKCVCRKTVAQGNVVIKYYNTFDLNTKVQTHYPESILSMPLHSLKLDWLLHGKKALTNNFLNSLHIAFEASKKDLGPVLYSQRQTNFLVQFRLHIRSNWTENKKGCFKLSGVEARNFMLHHEKLISVICDKPDTIALMKDLVHVFELIQRPREQKDDIYFSELLETTDRVLLLWAVRFGKADVKRKIYLHGLSHLAQVERFYLDNGYPTLESYTMQGREHRHKTLGAFRAKHFPMDETRRRGRKKQGQKEDEAIQIQEEQQIIDQISQSVDISWKARNFTKSMILEDVRALPKGTGSLTKAVLIEVAKSKKVKDTIWKKRIETCGADEHIKRTAAFQIVARSFRDLQHLDVKNNFESQEY
jgi:hypothetical protein